MRVYDGVNPKNTFLVRKDWYINCPRIISFFRLVSSFRTIDNYFWTGIWFSEHLEAVQSTWYDLVYHDGQCAERSGYVPGLKGYNTGKTILKYTSNELLCYYICQEARRRPPLRTRSGKGQPWINGDVAWMFGCEYDASTNICYSHAKRGQITKGNGKAESKCVIFETLAEEQGECIFLVHYSNPTPHRVAESISVDRKRFPEAREPKSCLAKCLEAKSEGVLIYGCEFTKLAGQEGACDGITTPFEGGSLQPSPEGDLQVCWKFWSNFEKVRPLWFIVCCSAFHTVPPLSVNVLEVQMLSGCTNIL